jgi:hypothetical protein
VLTVIAIIDYLGLGGEPFRDLIKRMSLVDLTAHGLYTVNYKYHTTFYIHNTQGQCQMAPNSQYGELGARAHRVHYMGNRMSASSPFRNSIYK